MHKKKEKTLMRVSIALLILSYLCWVPLVLLRINISADIELLLVMFPIVVPFILIPLIGMLDCHIRRNSKKRKKQWIIAILLAVFTVFVVYNFSSLMGEYADILLIVILISIFYLGLGFAFMEGECMHIKRLEKEGKVDVPFISKEEKDFALFFVSYFAAFFLAGLLLWAYHLGTILFVVLLFLAIISSFYAIKTYEKVKFSVFELSTKKYPEDKHKPIISFLIIVFAILFLYLMAEYVLFSPCFISIIIPQTIGIAFVKYFERKGDEKMMYIISFSIFFGVMLWAYILFVIAYMKNGMIENGEFLILVLGIGLLLFILLPYIVWLKKNS